MSILPPKILRVSEGMSTSQVANAVEATQFLTKFPESYNPGVERNSYRASNAVPALVAYAQHNGGLDSEPVETVIQDVLSDLMHLTDRIGTEYYFDALLEAARRRYAEEVAGE